MRVKSITTICALHALAVAGQEISVAASNNSASVIESATALSFAWDVGRPPRMPKVYDIQPLRTERNVTSLTSNTVLLGPLLLGSEADNQTFSSSNILAISCDDGDYGDRVAIQDTFERAIDKFVTAIVFLSREGNFCNVSSGPLPSNMVPVFSLTRASDSAALLDALSSRRALNTSMPEAVIAISSLLAGDPTTNRYLNGEATLSNNNNTSNRDDNEGTSGAPTTAVAMIILYSITGVITALFLLVIVTGAVRAHRHPERYGPSSGQGARQSRAKGLARAMLETLPIVKFTAPEQSQKPGDIEMNGGEHAHPTVTRAGDHAAKDLEQNLAGHVAPNAATNDANSVRSGIGPATLDTSAAVASASNAVASPRPNTAVTDDNNPGCSICTDDFEPGQDLRLLPCGHRFHPGCVDPWLLNVSGSCPLCRIDLNPNKKQGGSSPTAGDDYDEAERSDSVGTAGDGTSNPARVRTRRLSRLALGRFVSTAPLTSRVRRSRPRSTGPVVNTDAYNQVSLFSPTEPQTAVPETPGAQDTPTTPAVNTNTNANANRHSR